MTKKIIKFLTGSLSKKFPVEYVKPRAGVSQIKATEDLSTVEAYIPLAKAATKTETTLIVVTDASSSAKAKDATLPVIDTDNSLSDASTVYYSGGGADYNEDNDSEH